jgi:hypothetical protein
VLILCLLPSPPPSVCPPRLYDEVEVESILEEREGLDGETEYLVQFKVRGRATLGHACSCC